MNERYIPTKDLKTGVKVTAIIVGGVMESIKPVFKEVIYKESDTFLRKFRKLSSFK